MIKRERISEIIARIQIQGKFKSLLVIGITEGDTAFTEYTFETPLEVFMTRELVRLETEREISKIFTRK